MTKKKYELKDFFAKTNCEGAIKLVLQIDGKDTEHYLMVLGSEARSVARAKIDYGVEISDLNDALKKIEVKSERAETKVAGEAACNIKFALQFIDDWSFGDFTKAAALELLEENPAIAQSVIAKAFSHNGTVEGK